MKTAFFSLMLLGGAIAAAQNAPDAELLRQIVAIRAIDNHSHPPKVVAPGEKDDDYDALPCDPLEQAPMPVKVRAENLEFIDAWKALWSYQYNDATPEHVREVVTRKQQIRQQQGDAYPNWVLDKLGVDVELANRVALGRGLAPPRFRWVAFADALLFPLNNSGMANTPDRRIFYQREQTLLRRYMNDAGVQAMPASLNDYVSRVAVATLERWKQQGALAIKFEAAYLRTLNFEPATETEAARVYARYITNSSPALPVPTYREYKALQDYLFRAIAQNAGRLGMPVHIHSAAGCGTYFRLEDANPLNLESAFDDPALRKTTFVIIHGGWPWTQQATALMMKPNVWVDFSEQTWLLSTRQIAESLRQYLEWYPEKVLFGTDLSPGTAENDWEEIGWITAMDARRALAMALSSMINDGLITRERALEMARMAMHDNAAKLYGIGAP